MGYNCMFLFSSFFHLVFYILYVVLVNGGDRMRGFVQRGPWREARTKRLERRVVSPPP